MTIRQKLLGVAGGIVFVASTIGFLMDGRMFPWDEAPMRWSYRLLIVTLVIASIGAAVAWARWDFQRWGRRNP